MIVSGWNAGGFHPDCDFTITNEPPVMAGEREIPNTPDPACAATSERTGLCWCFACPDLGAGR